MHQRPRRKSSKPHPPALPKQPVTLEIESLGTQGDGVATHAGARIYVPCALPGERITARLHGPHGDGLAASLVEIENRSSARVEPPCPHFGTCGGCALQHLKQAEYLAWKRQRVVDALARRGFADPPVGEAGAIGPHSRRRATLVGQRRGRRAVVGFHRRRSDTPVEIEACAVLEPPLLDLVHALKRVLPDVLDRDERIGLHTLLTDTGLDLLIRTNREPTLDQRQALANFAEENDLARLSWRHDNDLEPIAWRRPALVRFGAADFSPAFQQSQPHR